MSFQNTAAIFALVTFLAAPVAYGQRLILAQALARTLQSSPELSSYSWDIRAAEARILQAKLRPNPDLSIESENITGSGDFKDSDEALENTLQLSQLVELGGKRSARVQEAQSDRQLADWEYQIKRIEVLRETTTRFIEALAAQRKVSAAALVALCGLLGSRMGAEFIPNLDEGDSALQVLRMPGTGLQQSVEMQFAVEKRLLQFLEVKETFARIGTAEVASDPMPPNIADGYIMLKPQNEWPNPTKTKAELVNEMNRAVVEIPGNNYEISQPIQLRFNELISGVRSDIGVKIFGDDIDQLLSAGQQIAAVLGRVPGAQDVKIEQVSGLPMLTINLKREMMSRYGLSVGEVQEVIEAAMGGAEAGSIF
jgi:multidrug efflux pump subunit AcrB